MTPQPEALRVMSFNLRYAKNETPNSWAERRPAASALLRRAEPHVVGTQEGLFGQLRDLGDDLGPRYAWIGIGREGGSRGEFAAVLYDTARLRPTAFDHFWLSDTPKVIASTGWGANSIRMATWVCFTDLTTGGGLYVANTHLDHVSALARLRGAELLVSRLAVLDPALPRIVTGDFNAPAAPGDPAYAAMLGGPCPLVDAWSAARVRGPGLGTFHGYGPPVPGGDRIDWILVSPEVRVASVSVDTFSRHGQRPSDHFPVRADVTLPVRPVRVIG